jgi:hypothetical protein
MGFLDAKAAAAKAQNRRKPADAVSVDPARSPTGNPSNRIRGFPRRTSAVAAPTRARGEPQGDRAVVVQAKVQDRTTIRTSPEGFQLGLEIRHAVAQWPEDLRDLWGERAAIIEYDGGEPRLMAERQAYEIVRTAHEAGLLMTEAK